MKNLKANEYVPYQMNYIKLVSEQNIVKGLIDQKLEMIHFFSSIPVFKQEYRYQEGKWTIKDLLLHLIDAERVFVYRALRIVRNDSTPLPGFDENSYAANADASHRNWKDMLIEWRTVRQATNLLFASFTPDQLKTKGNCNGHDVTVNALGFILFGHALHHLHILKERYDI